MKKMAKLIISLVVTHALLSCGGEADPPIIATPFEGFKGSNCKNASLYYFTVEGMNYKMEKYILDDCLASSPEIQYKITWLGTFYTLKRNESSYPEDTYDIVFNHQSAKLLPYTTTLVNEFNDNAYCGQDNWSQWIEVDLLNLDCSEMDLNSGKKSFLSFINRGNYIYFSEFTDDLFENENELDVLDNIDFDFYIL
jgi:hypothetical protein